MLAAPGVWGRVGETLLRAVRGTLLYIAATVIAAVAVGVLCVVCFLIGGTLWWACGAVPDAKTINDAASVYMVTVLGPLFVAFFGFVASHNAWTYIRWGTTSETGVQRARYEAQVRERVSGSVSLPEQEEAR